MQETCNMVILKLGILPFFQNITGQRPMLTFECFDIVTTFATAVFTRSTNITIVFVVFTIFNRACA